MGNPAMSKLLTPYSFEATFFAGSDVSYVNGCLVPFRSQFHHTMTDGWEEEVIYWHPRYNMLESTLNVPSTKKEVDEKPNGVEIVREAVSVPINMQQKLTISNLSGLASLKTEPNFHINPDKSEALYIREIHFGSYKPDEDDIKRKRREYLDQGHENDDAKGVFINQEDVLSLQEELRKERNVVGFVMELSSQRLSKAG